MSAKTPAARLDAIASSLRQLAADLGDPSDVLGLAGRVADAANAYADDNDVDWVADLSAHRETEYQVWVATPEGVPAYLYRANVGLHWTAQEWARQWNESHPADVADADRFVVVTATTAYTYRPEATR